MCIQCMYTNALVRPDFVVKKVDLAILGGDIQEILELLELGIVQIYLELLLR